ncbi:hypothetical protein ACWD0A_19510 [Streptomyces sp. NPDC002867]|uniref:hypothetical protein n=1 Tax=unclassified Streptomyces TaxID=2593676 RepID=UPI0015A3AB34|nr:MULTISPECIES: hypothetical protein [unclassified Streptomyces]MDQ1009284.1 hypothetical protein [Streptomyces sp. V4I23]NWF27096.1 hypothetical protein [Streptomyces sp. PKU-EA00015]
MAGNPPIVVHRISPSGGRRVTVRGRIMGLAHSDEEVLELVRRSGETGAVVLEDPTWVEWTGGRPHQYEPLELLP